MMNKETRTLGIILKRRNIGEADRLLFIFTEELGKVTAVGRGLRKIKAKLAGHLEPFSLTNLQLIKGRNLYTVIGAQLIERFALPEEIEKIAEAGFICEVLDKALRDEAPHQDLFQSSILALREVSKFGHPSPKVRSFFILESLLETGFHPELNKCVQCGEKLVPEGNKFSLAHGGLVCHRHQGEEGAEISAEAIKVLRLFSSRDLEMTQKINIPEKIVAEVSGWCHRFMEWVLERELKSEKFLRQISN